MNKLKRRKNPDALNNSNIRDRIFQKLTRIVELYKSSIWQKHAIDFNVEKHQLYLQTLFEILRNSIDIKYLGAGFFTEVYKINLLKAIGPLNSGIYALKIYKAIISPDCYKNLIKYSNLKLIVKIYILNRYYMITDCVEGEDFLKIKSKYFKKLISKRIYENLYAKKLIIEEKFNNLFSNDPNLDITGDSNYMVTNDYKSIFLIDPCY